MLGKDVYKCWYKENNKWCKWIKPTLFVDLDNQILKDIVDYEIPHIFYVDKLRSDTAIIIDEDGDKTIKEGIALINFGYTLVPLFNSPYPLPKSRSLVNNSSIAALLIWGAAILKDKDVVDDAPPVFLLNSNRLNRYRKDKSLFDNSYDIYSQDLPTSNYFKNNGIKNIIVKSDKINPHLNEILNKYRKNGINILYTNGFELPKKAKLKKVPKKHNIDDEDFW